MSECDSNSMHLFYFSVLNTKEKIKQLELSVCVCVQKWLKLNMLKKMPRQCLNVAEVHSTATQSMQFQVGTPGEENVALPSP